MKVATDRGGKGDVKAVFELMETAVMVSNVRDAVRGLPGVSALVGPVEFYGDRGVSTVPINRAVLKSPRNPKEAEVMRNFLSFLRDMGVGAKSVIFSSCHLGGGSGIISRLHADPSCLEGAGSIAPFIVTPEVQSLAERVGAMIVGSPSEVSARINNKACQRQIAAACGLSEIFPPHILAENEEEARRAYREISTRGGVIAKVGHLASGEGMEMVHSEEEAVTFFRKWSDVLRTNGLEEVVVFEQMMQLSAPPNSVSVQYFVDHQGRPSYLGASAQHIGPDGVTHEGNMTGADIHSRISQRVETEIMMIADKLLPHLSGVRGFVGFDFIICGDGRVLITEVNLRMTASTLLYGMEAQLPGLSYDLRKVHVGPFPRIGASRLFSRLGDYNQGGRLVVPLNPRLFDQTGDMFVIVCAPTLDETDSIFKEFTGWFK